MHNSSQIVIFRNSSVIYTGSFKLRQLNEVNSQMGCYYSRQVFVPFHPTRILDCLDKQQQLNVSTSKAVCNTWKSTEWFCIKLWKSFSNNGQYVCMHARIICMHWFTQVLDILWILLILSASYNNANANQLLNFIS